jgi:4-amino-4-deoxy-L-arabinose transferase-like glycosyltransferase
MTWSRSEGSPDRGFADRGLWLVLLGSFAVLAILLAATREMTCAGDACMFIHCARSLLRGDGWDYAGPWLSWDSGHTPPLYVFFLMFHLALFDSGLLASKATQAVLVLAMAALAYHSARNAWGRRAGLWAAALVGFCPSLLAFAHYNFNEVLFSFLLLLALTLLLREKRGLAARELATLVVAGVVLGLATLTRETTWFLAPILAAWVSFSRPWNLRRALRRFAAVELPVVALVVPWAAYNTYRFGEFLLLSTNAGNVLYHNQNSGPPENHDFRARRVGPVAYPEPPRPRCGLMNPVENYRCEIANARAYMRAHPERVAARAIPKLAALMNPTSFPLRFLRAGRYGDAGPGTVRAVTLVTAGSFMALALLGVVAIWLGPPGPERQLTVIVLLFFLSVVALTFGMSRYRVPLMPLFAMQASSVLANFRFLTSQRISPIRGAGLVATLAFLGWAWSKYLPLITDVF